MPLRPLWVRFSRASFELPGEYISQIIGTLVLVGGKVVHLVRHPLHQQMTTPGRVDTASAFLY